MLPALRWAALVGAGLAVVRWAVPPDRPPEHVRAPDVVPAIDRWLEARWRDHGLTPAPLADELTVLRRTHLALVGRPPSLEEIRRFEGVSPGPGRLVDWTAELLEDPRFSAYFAERLARAFTGAEVGPFLVFRRDRFTAWLDAELRAHRPYDAIVREMLTARGTWTASPATNFITVAAHESTLDAAKLTGRLSRAFLGQRIDCAECHDHPFDDWKRSDFQGLAGWFAEAKVSPLGLRELTGSSTRAAAFPFGAAWDPGRGDRRARLAAWVTHRENARFGRAAVNRVAGLVFGRPFHAPVDDLPDPGERDLLDLLADDFVTHEYDLRRLILALTASRAFHLASTGPAEELAAFPLTTLRPEQLVGALLQGSSARTLGPNDGPFSRAIAFLRETSFVKEYGDAGDDELAPQAATIPQALLRMNGKLPAELTEANPFTLTGRISGLARSPSAGLEALFLALLTRRPTDDERARFLPLVDVTDGAARRQAYEDLAWAITNSAEWTWNH